jgi:hypothetical protein
LAIFATSETTTTRYEKEGVMTYPFRETMREDPLKKEDQAQTRNRPGDNVLSLRVAKRGQI